MYKSIIRPCLFRIDAEKIHDQIITLLHIYRHLGPIRSLTRSLFHPKAVPFQWQNLNFSNRVGLSAGFDKEANCFDELSDLGFGFIEVGTVTPHKVDGNPSPRIFRLPKDHALISRTGFNNPGKEMVLHVSGNLAVSMIRKVGLPTYEIQNKDYGYRKFNKKVHIMEQNP